MPYVPSRSQLNSKTVWVVALNLLALAAALTVLQRAWIFVSWILVAAFVAVALNAPVRMLERRGVKRGFGIAIVYVALLAFLGLLFTTLVPLMVEQGRNLVNAAPGLVQSLQDQKWFQWADSRFEISVKAQTAIQERAGKMAQPVFGVVLAVFSGLFGMVTVLMLSIFMLLFGRELIGKALLWIEPTRRNRYRVMTRQIENAVGGYVLGTLLVSLLGGVAVALAMLFTGVPYFLPIGMAVGILGVIPFVGSAIAMVLMVGTALTTKGLQATIICVIAYEVFLNLKNKLIAPLIQRHTLNMNPLLIAMVLLVGTGIGGILGAVLALPVAGAAQVVLRDVLWRRQLRWMHSHKPEQPRQLDWVDDLHADARYETELRH